MQEDRQVQVATHELGIGCGQTHEDTRANDVLDAVGLRLCCRAALDRSSCRAPARVYGFCRSARAGEGFLGINFLRLYPRDELTAANREYHVSEFLPGCQLSGSDGCGNAYLFDFEK